MEKHTVPQNIMDVEFKLFGELTVRQFGYILGGGFVALFFWFIFGSLPLIKYFFVAVSVGLGLSLALLKVNNQPFEIWLANYLKALFTSQKRVWKKENKAPDFLQEGEVVMKSYTKTEAQMKNIITDDESGDVDGPRAEFMPHPVTMIVAKDDKKEKKKVAKVVNSDIDLGAKPVGVVGGLEKDNQNDQFNNLQQNANFAMNQNTVQSIQFPSPAVPNTPVNTQNYNPADPNTGFPGTTQPMNDFNNNQMTPVVNSSAVTPVNPSSQIQQIPQATSPVPTASPVDLANINGDSDEKVATKIEDEDLDDDFSVFLEDDQQNNQGVNTDTQQKYTAPLSQDVLPQNYSVPVSTNALPQQNNVQIQPASVSTTVAASNVYDPFAANSSDIQPQPLQQSDPVSIPPIPTVPSVAAVSRVDEGAVARENETLKEQLNSLQQELQSNAQEYSNSSLQNQNIINNLQQELLSSKQQYEDIASQNKSLTEQIEQIKQQLTMLTQQKNASNEPQVFNSQVNNQQYTQQPISQLGSALPSMQNVSPVVEPQQNILPANEPSSNVLPPLGQVESINTDIEQTLLTPAVYNGPSLSKKSNVISGIVKDVQDKLLPGVIVIIKNSQNRPVRAMKTNSLGQFLTTTALEDGTYTIELTKSNYNFNKYQVVLNGQILSTFEFIAK